MIQKARKAAVLAVLLALTTFTWAFGSTRTLSRNEAEALVDAHPDFVTAKIVPCTEEALMASYRDHLWVGGRLGDAFRPLGEGSKYFESLSYGFPRTVTLTTPLKREFREVTGISDGATLTTKEVSFTWAFKEIPDFVARYTGLATGTRKGKAVLRLYDDGWRVETLALP